MKTTLSRESKLSTQISNKQMTQLIPEPSTCMVLVVAALMDMAMDLADMGLGGMTLVAMVLMVDTDIATGRDMLVETMVGDTILTSPGNTTGTGEETQTDRCTTCRT